MNVRCPVCGAAVVLAVGDTRLACTSCGLAAPVSRVGTAPGTAASAMLALESDLTGTVVAGYELVEKIGAGGMGTVYRARRAGDDAKDVDSASGEGPADVAVKILRPGLGAERAAMLVRFAREAEALRRLEHPRVVRFLEHGEEGDIAYIVTELVEGRDLAAQLAQGRMSLDQIVRVFGEVCDGVAAAHAAGIVHRDLKPANILVGSDGVKVADFGLAQLGADVSIPTLTRTDVAMGTFHYLAPEQRKDARTVDHRADVWALGVIFYEMLTGELPLGSFAPPSTNGPEGCDRRADAIVRTALAPDPADRYASVAELARSVRGLVARPRLARRWLALAATAAVAGTSAIAFAVSSSGTTATTARTAAVSDATIDGETVVASAPIDASTLDAFEVAVASTPIDAGIDAAPVVAVAVPAAGSGSASRPTQPSLPSRPKPGPKPAGEGKVSPGKVPVQAPNCRKASQCCSAVGGGNCGTWLTSTAGECATALADFRSRATKPVHFKVCGSPGKTGGATTTTGGKAGSGKPAEIE